MPAVVVYLGPSLSVHEAEEILPSADYLPPVKRGDLGALSARNPDIVGIIDGVFFQDAAVGHREILSLLEAGVTVIGASSMGALRAVELLPFGMIGIGKVFCMYRDGIVISDDEVALICDPISHTPLSEALVNIRVTLDDAAEKGIFSSDDAGLILKTAQQIYYPERTYETILSRCRGELRSVSVDDALVWLQHNRIDQKRADAIEAITSIRDQFFSGT
ncbi:MAG: TfuA-related McrA-glycine thioamidation protein [Methanospirillaceae archaeon]|nr:TfuA-related McrA-glycine thioamidation protein [Methanospirillaceae archaeon]